MHELPTLPPNTFHGTVAFIPDHTKAVIAIELGFGISRTLTVRILPNGPPDERAKHCLVTLLGGKKVVVWFENVHAASPIHTAKVYVRGTAPNEDCEETFAGAAYVNVNTLMQYLEANNYPVEQARYASRRGGAAKVT